MSNAAERNQHKPWLGEADGLAIWRPRPVTGPLGEGKAANRCRLSATHGRERFYLMHDRCQSTLAGGAPAEATAVPGLANARFFRRAKTARRPVIVAANL